MKNLIFIFYLIIFCSSCDEKDIDSIDITINDWKLVSIKLENETINISENSYVKASSFILKFTDNSTFFLDTSVNAAMGNYAINNYKIKLTNYQELTEVATNDIEQIKINEFLLQHLVNVTRFSTDHNELIFHSENEDFIFKRN